MARLRVRASSEGQGSHLRGGGLHRRSGRVGTILFIRGGRSEESANLCNQNAGRKLRVSRGGCGVAFVSFFSKNKNAAFACGVRKKKRRDHTLCASKQGLKKRKGTHRLFYSPNTPAKGRDEFAQHVLTAGVASVRGAVAHFFCWMQTKTSLFLLARRPRINCKSTMEENLSS